MSAPAVAASRGGEEFAAAWKDVRSGDPDVWWAVGAEPGRGKESAVQADRRGAQDHPSLCAASQGWFLAWEDGPKERRVVRGRFLGGDDDATAVSDLARDGPAAFPVVAAGADFVVVAWESEKAGTSRALVRVLPSR
jgi:hypothetical protein